ncbi:hypothetical protein PPERSA_07363 [Pseudocohnilembus persalinus]|uniref:EF-hand domain-containing protein n=1 Tax=Pseudocohnilembus persalinus TaxID=266149 RepID=A0A0V0Q9L0_PSEPJ|nr:hypothetical protein PPERSA_07363 [Pseudocohnilembus persalinus]|eukprot:KRW98865.1 hypothetical protein PPERSA_07363 [Pseudocohnilembus persalinus]
MEKTGELGLTRPQVTLNDGLPKKSPAEVLEEIKAIFVSENDRYFPENGERMIRLQNNFDLFDRDNDGLLKYPELKELLISINMMLPEQELEELYKEVIKQTQEPRGVSIDIVKYFVCKKLREEDKECQLYEAFKIIAGPDQDHIETEAFKELLMTMGLKWDEEQADEFLKTADPKSEGKFVYDDLVRKLMKR